MAGHAVRWQGTGSVEVSPRDQKSKNPDNLLISWRERKINGAYYKLYSHQSGYAGSIVLCSEKFKT
ncbi:protein CopA/IncA [Salmonella enterica]|nr:protein CopA/IncA [Salmonella enterica subsp. enterica serovar Give]EJB3413006.1 protein CopA/IncA [Salmonella enterica]EJX2353518.1 protein CopA/IncA [Salmonella enterica]EJX2519092.1 protein CopA/IncA [Salmonella enterica]EKC5846150.1 protein CopA/IncA [Salmonella enterica]